MVALSALVLACVLLFLFALHALPCRRPPNLPLGPKGEFFVGNLKVIQSKYPWKKYSEWSKSFGDIIYMTVVGRPFVVLNKYEHARELLDKHSTTYSDRPRMYYIVEMLKIRSATFMPYGDTWRLYRRLMQQYLNPRAVVMFRPMQTSCVHDLLQDLLSEPNDFWRIIKRRVKHFLFAASTVLSATYGYQVERKDDPIMKLHERTDGSVGRFLSGTTFVDLFPPLRYVPSFFPGASFKRHALKTSAIYQEIMDRPYETVRIQRLAGTATSCLLARMLDDYEHQGIDDQERYRAIKDTSSTIYTFFLAMVLHPHVARKAQSVLDAVLGGERLPTFDDQESLPYINCILKECLRWNPPFPLALPHRAMREGALEGKYIPNGSIVVPNVWYMMHDECNYDDPMSFNPDRFSKIDNKGTPSILDPQVAVFGFGRRICPGRHFAEAAVWLTIANVLAVFDILPPLDENGREILPNSEASSGFGSQPAEFTCRLVPRSTEAVNLVRNARR
ncbi:cytochrome P450 [Fomitiporia mediterranea MF3/22]|uniref:cytochrome P450 n=1 Tax=Fomitiporia mediterranea (strain MF3/22) TaxID=694068 RepID=UPI0004407CFC|nr:cytochrome P450 [Fomitiporia mediterranea MF3/22]EJD04923.1 cytochrome P450 [Fomitiporia mediterranea MF3/22]